MASCCRPSPCPSLEQVIALAICYVLASNYVPITQLLAGSLRLKITPTKFAVIQTVRQSTQ